ncbi:MAG: hypothetical protein JNN11_03910 [Candidatus Doudnabacteria bacterium]|nr:hypothetical protein [Candidatus Doudnabacteria bacterium]
MNLLIDIIFLLAAVSLEIKYKIKLFSSLKTRLLVLGFIFIVLMGWEFINFWFFKAWLYPGKGMVGVYFYGLPLELYLFFLTAPYFSLIVYALVHREIDEPR